MEVTATQAHLNQLSKLLGTYIYCKGLVHTSSKTIETLLTPQTLPLDTVMVQTWNWTIIISQHFSFFTYYHAVSFHSMCKDLKLKGKVPITLS